LCYLLKNDLAGHENFASYWEKLHGSYRCIVDCHWYYVTLLWIDIGIACGVFSKMTEDGEIILEASLRCADLTCPNCSASWGPPWVTFRSGSSFKLTLKSRKYVFGNFVYLTYKACFLVEYDEVLADWLLFSNRKSIWSLYPRICFQVLAAFASDFN